MEHQKLDLFFEGIDKKSPKPFYLIFGNEPWLMGEALKFFKQKWFGEAQNNVFHFDAQTTDVEEVIQTLKTPSLFGDRQLVVVENINKINRQKQIIKYLEKPSETHILLAHCASVKSQFLTELRTFCKSDVGDSYFAEKLRVKDVQNQIIELVKKNGFSIDNDVVIRLSEAGNNDMNAISNEVKKIMSRLSSGANIGKKEFEEHTSFELSYTVFNLNSAIAHRNMRQIEKIMDFMSANPSKFPIQMAIGSLFSFFNNAIIYRKYQDQSESVLISKLGINQYALQYLHRDLKPLLRFYNSMQLLKIVEVLNEYDIRSKGKIGNIEPQILLRDMIFRVLYMR